MAFTRYYCTIRSHVSPFSSFCQSFVLFSYNFFFFLSFRLSFPIEPLSPYCKTLPCSPPSLFLSFRSCDAHAIIRLRCALKQTRIVPFSFIIPFTPYQLRAHLVMGRLPMVLPSSLRGGSCGSLGLLMRNRNPIFYRGLKSRAAATSNIKTPSPSSLTTTSIASILNPANSSSSLPLLSSNSHSCISSASSLNTIPALRHPSMASSSRSADSSDVYTPRSASPTPSVTSGRSSRTAVSNKRMSISSRRLTDFNPMSSVDVSAIEEAMKAASLDQYRGYAQDHYTEVKQDHDTEYLKESDASAYQVLREPLWNKGMQTLFLQSIYIAHPLYSSFYFRSASVNHILHSDWNYFYDTIQSTVENIPTTLYHYNIPLQSLG